MNSLSTFNKLSQLPQSLQQKVADFIDSLFKNIEQDKTPGKPKFGSGKGMFKMMPDFDEPLEDFEEYM